MRRDFTKNNAKKRSWHKRFGFMSLLGLIAAAFFCAFITFNLVKKHWQMPTYISAYITRFNTWIAERKHHLNPVAKVKQIAMDKTNAPEPIHFEFYTALPNMQVGMPNSVSHSNVVDNEKTNGKKAVNAAPFISAEQLEKDFAREIKTDKHQKKIAQRKLSKRENIQ